MKEELELTENLNSEIVKIINTDNDEYNVYFNFLSIPVVVNKSYLSSIIGQLDNNKIDTSIN